VGVAHATSTFQTTFQTASECKSAERDKAEEEEIRQQIKAEKEKVREELEAVKRAHAAALGGVATLADFDLLTSMGYLIADGRLVKCPACGHDRFDQQRMLMQINYVDLSDPGVDARICARCTFIMCFAGK
jgi:hypothetical protein